MLFAVACALVAAAPASAFVTQEIVDKGSADKLRIKEFRFYIPDAQCSGWIDTKLLLCGLMSPTNIAYLNVTVWDAQSVGLSLHQLESVTIYRRGPCEGEAWVTVQRQCGSATPALAATAKARPPGRLALSALPELPQLHPFPSDNDILSADEPYELLPV